eukprot:scaffold334_cov241-Pinguiococcus_pyrenoidosus.AAC.45
MVQREAGAPRHGHVLGAPGRPAEGALVLIAMVLWDALQLFPLPGAGSGDSQRPIRLKVCLGGNEGPPDAHLRIGHHEDLALRPDRDDGLGLQLPHVRADLLVLPVAVVQPLNQADVLLRMFGRSVDGLQLDKQAAIPLVDSHREDSQAPPRAISFGLRIRCIGRAQGILDAPSQILAPHHRAGLQLAQRRVIAVGA